MMQKSIWISAFILISLLTVGPFLISASSLSGLPSFSNHLQFKTLHTTSEGKSNRTGPAIPQAQASDWLDVVLTTQFFYNDSVMVSWRGHSDTTEFPNPFYPLYNWTDEGTIAGGVWTGNPGNATITALAKNNETSSLAIAEFLNFTMENYVRFESWPSLNIFNFTEYENTTDWVFVDQISTTVEFWNTTFYLVNNATSHLINGFNATRIAATATEWQINMRWDSSGGTLNFSYSQPQVTQLQMNTYTFSLARALGRTSPLTLIGTGDVIIRGPYDRLVLSATPESQFPGISFPHLPIGQEIFSHTQLTEQDFDIMIQFRQATSGLNIMRVATPTSVSRGQVLQINVTVQNTGDTPHLGVAINDVGGLLTGAFALVSGSASMVLPFLAAGESYSMVYTMMALQPGVFELPAASAITTDLLQNQLVNATNPTAIQVGNGLLPSELSILMLAAGFAIIVIMIFIVYRILKRYR